MKRDALTFPALPVLAARDAQAGWRTALPALAFALLWIVGWYASTGAEMVDTWARSETYAHGFVVVPITLWLVWRMRERLATLSPGPAWLPVTLLAAAGFAWLLGEFGAVNAVSQEAFVAMLVLCVSAILGPSVTRAMLFPLGFLFFAVPIGNFLLPVLMERTADFTIMALRASGVPVYREGLQFVIPTGRWSIVEACSGVRYLIASLMTGTLFAYLTYRALWRRLAFVGVAIVVPIVANWLRAYMIVMLGHLSNNRLATGVDHLIYGWLFFGFVMLLMFWIGSHWREPPMPARATEMPAAQGSPSSHAVSWTVVAAVLAITAVWPVVSAVTRQDDGLHPVALGPIAVPGWSTESTSEIQDFKPIFKLPSATRDETLRRDDATVGLYIAYYRGQSFRRKLVSSENMLVPSTGSEWHRFAVGKRNVVIDGAPREVAVTHLVAPGGRELFAWQWYWVGGALTSSDIVAKARIIWLRLTGRGDDAAGIVIYTPRREGKDPELALRAFTSDAWPQIEAALVSARVNR
jgi:exosortase A